jgi:hypothetical protein
VQYDRHTLRLFKCRIRSDVVDNFGYASSFALLRSKLSEAIVRSTEVESNRMENQSNNRPEIQGCNVSARLHRSKAMDGGANCLFPVSPFIFR